MHVYLERRMIFPPCQEVGNININVNIKEIISIDKDTQKRRTEHKILCYSATISPSSPSRLPEWQEGLLHLLT